VHGGQAQHGASPRHGTVPEHLTRHAHKHLIKRSAALALPLLTFRLDVSCHDGNSRGLAAKRTPAPVLSWRLASPIAPSPRTPVRRCCAQPWPIPHPPHTPHRHCFHPLTVLPLPLPLPLPLLILSRSILPSPTPTLPRPPPPVPPRAPLLPPGAKKAASQRDAEKAKKEVVEPEKAKSPKGPAAHGAGAGAGATACMLCLRGCDPRASPARPTRWMCLCVVRVMVPPSDCPRVSIMRTLGASSGALPGVAGLAGLTQGAGPDRVAAALAALGVVPHGEASPDLTVERPVGHTSHNLFLRCKKDKNKFYLVTLRQVNVVCEIQRGPGCAVLVPCGLSGVHLRVSCLVMCRIGT
jgi:hypothetical protein